MNKGLIIGALGAIALVGSIVMNKNPEMHTFALPVMIIGLVVGVVGVMLSMKHDKNS